MRWGAPVLLQTSYSKTIPYRSGENLRLILVSQKFLVPTHVPMRTDVEDGSLCVP